MPKLVFITADSGAVHDVPEGHYSIALAEQNREGFRFATEKEVREYFKLQMGVEDIDAWLKTENGLRPADLALELPDQLRPKKAAAGGAATKE